MLLLNGDDPNCVEYRRDLAPAGASAAKKRYRGSFQQWGFDGIHAKLLTQLAS